MSSRKHTSLSYLALTFVLSAVCVTALSQYRGDAVSLAGANEGAGQPPRRRHVQELRASGVARPDSLRALPLEYEGAAEQADQAWQRTARPLALASADFDEDGVADVVGGFAASGRGLLTFNRGNADTIYPNSPLAQKRRAEGAHEALPFLSPGRVFDMAEPPHFLGAGDFDGDGHQDLVAANRGGHLLHVLRGDGSGSFSEARSLELPGAVTTLVTGDMNRPDGLADIVVAVEGAGGAAVLVFEGPDGALEAPPERVPLPASAPSVAVGQLDAEPSFDLAIAAGSELLIVRGRDRKLSLDLQARSAVRPPTVERHDFPSTLVAVAAGDFSATPHDDLAVLGQDGVLHLLSRAPAEAAAKGKARAVPEWRREAVASESWSPTTRMFGARTSGASTEDVLILDPQAGQLKVLSASGSAAGVAHARVEVKAARKLATAFGAGATPVAVLPMQLDADALNDLVVLQNDSVAPAVSMTAQPEAAGAPAELTAPAAPRAQPQTKNPKGSGPTGSPFGHVNDAHGPASEQQPPPVTTAQAAAPCGLSDPIPFGVQVSGALGPPLNSLDCRYPISGEYYDRYAFFGTAGQRVAIAMVSTEFDPGLILYAPNGTALAVNDDSSDGTVARIPASSGFVTLPVTGTYTIDATTIYLDETGNYQIMMVAQDPAGCPENRISGGDVFIGALTVNDCSFPAGQRAHVYSFFAAANQRVAIYMASADIDSFLILEHPSGTRVSDDDGGDFLDSRIPPDGGTLTLPETGIYRIYVTSFDPNDFGVYQLEVQLGGPTVVTNTNDSGAGSLRQAILNANSMPGPDIISFAIGTGAKTINLLSPLPPVAGVTLIDGATQPGFAGVPLIELNGASAGVRAAGLKLTAGSSRVRGLVINRFAYGVAITNNGGNLIDGNYIGTNLAGTTALGNKRNGVVIFNSVNNVVGGTTAAARNVISGNLGIGVEIGRDGSSNNIVSGNYIGTDVSGNFAVGNATNGVLIRVGTNNLVGGAVAGARNVISGNGAPGVAVGYTLPLGNLIQGNHIGTNAAGTAAVGNGGAGLIIGGIDVNLTLVTANNNLIGGTVPAARNLISGNLGQGVEINNEGSRDNFVQGNFIGTNAAGTAALGNNGVGISVTFAPGNVIGGTAAGAGNVVSGNQGQTGFGVAIGIPREQLAGGTGVIVQGNFIGTDSGRTLRLGNAQDGVFVDAKSVVNTITGNTIAFNGRSGVYIPNTPTQPGVQIRIELNDIYANGDLAIDLGERGVTNNDPLDTDLGANLQQNFPTLQSASFSPLLAAGASAPEASAATSITVSATLESAPNTLYVVQWGFTADQQCSPKNQPQSRVLANGKIPNVLTNAQGRATLDIPFTFPAGVAQGVIYTNAIDPLGNTSENSPCLTVSSTPPAGGTLQLSLGSYSVGEGGGSLQVNVTRTVSSTGSVGVSYSTSDGIAKAGQDYAATSGTLAFAAGVTTRSFTVPITGDALDEEDETFSLTLSNPTGGASLGSQVNATVTIVDDDVITVEFESAAYAVGEAARAVQARVLRSGDTTQAVSVDYATADQTATERRDYSLTLGRLQFAAGESAKTVNVLIADDGYVEPSETFRLVLSNPSGRTVVGARNAATVTINSDDAAGSPNPIDAAEYFVGQQYADFFNRLPDADGLAFWKGEVEKKTAPCATLADPGARARCVLGGRSLVSTAFFLSIEFQNTGYLVIRFHTEAFGRLPRMREFAADTQEVGRNVVVGAAGWEALLEANRLNFAERFTARPEFVQRYGSMSDAAFVNTLFANAGVGEGEEAALRQALVGGLAAKTETRASVLRKVADSRSVFNRQYNSAFVLMQYFGYLRRDPNDLPDTDWRGYDFWLSKLNVFTNAGEDARNEGDALGRAQRAEMVEAFVDSIEYRTRFAP